MNHTKRILQLDGLRLVMILLIIISHFEFLLDFSYGGFYWRYLHNPTLPVDYFFMLSGFGIYYGANIKSHPQKNDRFKIKEMVAYALVKIRRIYPIYILSLVISIPYNVISRVEYYGQSLIGAIGKTVFLFGVASTLLQSATGISIFANAINGVGWFLSALFVSYMVAPLFLRFCNRVVKGLYGSLMAIAGVVIVILMLTYLLGLVEINHYFNVPFDYLVYGSPYIRCFYLLLGMLVAKLHIQIMANELALKLAARHQRLFELQEVAIVGVAVMYFAYRNSLMITALTARCFDLIICIAFILTMSLGFGKFSKLLSNPKIVKLSDLSMYLFLLHLPVVSIVVYVWKSYIGYFGPLTGVLEVMTIFVLTFVLSLAVKKHMPELNNRICSIFKRHFEVS